MDDEKVLELLTDSGNVIQHYYTELYKKKNNQKWNSKNLGGINRLNETVFVSPLVVYIKEIDLVSKQNLCKLIKYKTFHYLDFLSTKDDIKMSVRVTT